MSQIQSWRSEEWGPLTLDSIRALHTPPHHFRISHSRIQRTELRDGDTLGGLSRAGRIYVLNGAVEVTPPRSGGRRARGGRDRRGAAGVGRARLGVCVEARAEVEKGDILLFGVIALSAEFTRLPKS